VELDGKIGRGGFDVMDGGRQGEVKLRDRHGSWWSGCGTGCQRRWCWLYERGGDGREERCRYAGCLSVEVMGERSDD
jgi:hypothetical protein